MDQRQNTYNNQQMPLNMQQPMTPPPMPPRGQWQQRAMNAIGGFKTIFPKWLTQYSALVYILSLTMVSLIYSSYSLPWYYMFSGVVAIVVFFVYGSFLSERTQPLKLRREKSFEQRIFWIAFIPRVIWMFLIYIIFIQNYGDSFGFENADATGYDKLGYLFKEAMSDGRFFDEWKDQQAFVDVSDMGYATYLGLIYMLTGCGGVESYDGIGADSVGIFAVRLMKCIWSALTVVLIYRLAKRNFDSRTARVAAIFVALWPNFWYYCGCHLKEVEMVFLSVLFVEQADQMLRSRQFTAWKVMPVLLIGASLLTLRTPLALVAFMSLLFSLVMSSSRVVSQGKRIIVGGLAVLLIVVTLGNRIQEEARGLVETVQSGGQRENMEWRSNRADAGVNAQKFSKYAGAAVFAPMIFTLPFPSMVRPFEGQEVQQLLNGGNYIKNIISAFTILALVTLLLSGKWRDHMLPLSFMVGYAVVLAFSNFAQSERFHQPDMPFELMFAAYGLSVAVTKPKYKRWFTYWCGVMFIAAIAWNWFKLAGRGLV